MDKLGTISKEELGLLFKSAPVAYFCAEFAVDQKLPIYAGGLGVLAGDLLFQASEEGLSYVGVGLYYDHGYLHQEVSQTANLVLEENFSPQDSGLKLVTQDGKAVIIEVPIHDRQTKVQCYLKMVDHCPLLLLSTNVEGNTPHETGITDRLYYGDREHRFEQEMILGIGGFRMLTALDINPHFYHLNEGHSALLFFELAHSIQMKNPDLRYAEILQHLGRVVFTNHTLVSAGNDVFSKDLAISYLQNYALQIPINPNELVGYGVIDDTSLFSTTLLALRLATVSQAVSKLHAKSALEIWSHHPMVPVTNGVRQHFWQASEIAKVDKQSELGLWTAHTQCKRLLCEYIEETTGTVWNEQDLILGWSRRIARYKRPLSIFEDPERLRKILQHSSIPVRLVIAGKPHMNDELGQDNLKHILEMVGQFGGSVVYLQNYSLDLAKRMLSGVDVLVNTPVRGFEACGTSGMKAGLNGVLQCTTLDGWTDEVDWSNLGWVLDSEQTSQDFYSKLEQEIIPLFLKRGADGLPHDWLKRMQKMINLVVTGYTAARMLRELQELVYSQIREEV